VHLIKLFNFLSTKACLRFLFINYVIHSFIFPAQVVEYLLFPRHCFINKSIRKITLNSNKNVKFISLVEEVVYEWKKCLPLLEIS
jgi:hypothetical protein